MQSLAVNYVNNGSLVTLLMQFAIPSSMIISFVFLRTRYKLSQVWLRRGPRAGVACLLAESGGKGGGRGSPSCSWRQEPCPCHGRT